MSGERPAADDRFGSTTARSVGVYHDRGCRWVVRKCLPVGATGLVTVGGVMDHAFAHQDHELTGVLVRQTVLPLRE